MQWTKLKEWQHRTDINVTVKPYSYKDKIVSVCEMAHTSWSMWSLWSFQACSDLYSPTSHFTVSLAKMEHLVASSRVQRSEFIR